MWAILINVIFQIIEYETGRNEFAIEIKIQFYISTTWFIWTKVLNFHEPGARHMNMVTYAQNYATQIAGPKRQNQ